MNKKRSSMIAGTWYPGSETALRAMIQNYFDQVDISSSENEICGIISPHAGYMYSGQTAAYGYKLLANTHYDHIIVLSPMHYYPPGKYVVNDSICYETPFGCVSVDHEFIEKLSKKVKMTYVPFDQEHSLEIQLPFLQMIFNPLRIIPIMIGHGDLDNCDELADALVKLCQDKSCLVVASSDMHHTSNYEETRENDESVVQSLKRFDLNDIKEKMDTPNCSICGKIPVLTMLKFCQNRGCHTVNILHQTNSGDITGEKQKGKYTVGYLSASVC